MIHAPRALPSILALLAVAAACDASPGYLKDEGRRHRLAELGVERFDSTGRYRLAGVSATRDVEVAALKPGELGADTLDAGYHAFGMRCGTCHDVPSPGSKPAYLWDAVVSRMKRNARDAGLMPMSPGNEAAVLRFLREHAADRR